MYPNETPNSLSSQFMRAANPVKFLIVILVLLVVSGIAYGIGRYVIGNSLFQKPMTQHEKLESAIESITWGSVIDPVPLQNFFLDSVKSNSKDADTVSAVYWITHRYFDNGGDIYEIYNYIHAHPKELSFLITAETGNPTAFKTVQDGTAGKYSYESLQALLAYYDVLDMYGYGSIELWGIAANKYSELYRLILDTTGHKNITIADNGDTPISREKLAAHMIERAQYFAAKCASFISDNAGENGKIENLLNVQVRPEDLLVGLNQYNSAVLNLKGMKAVRADLYTPEQIYEFSVNLAQTKVQRLYFFTNYLYATGLINAGDATVESVKKPLGRALEYAKVNKEFSPKRSMGRVLLSKTSGESSVFSYSYTKKLAALNSDFRAWLLANGWTEADLK